MERTVIKKVKQNESRKSVPTEFVQGDLLFPGRIDNVTSTREGTGSEKGDAESNVRACARQKGEIVSENCIKCK